MMTDMDINVRHGNCFKLLAACFYEPDKELFLQEHLCENLASLLSACQCERAASAAALMHKALTVENDEELKVEYARLFLGPFELVAPPYGSLYLEENRRLMGESTMAVQKQYQESGLSLEVMEAPDHIALELEFMHYLCLMEVAAVTENGNDPADKSVPRQAEFFRDYLAPWVPGFCEKIRHGTEKTFYAHLADCLEDFISEISPVFKMTTPFPPAGTHHDCRTSTAKF